MSFLLMALALAQVALGGHVAVRMPFLNPAGVTYVQGQYQAAAYAAPTGYEAPGAYQYSQEHQPFAYTQHAQYPQQAYQQVISPEYYQHAAPVHHQEYAQVAVKTHVEVPTVKHVQAVADVPVTKIEAQHGFVQKLVDVAKPAIKTRKFEIRRPAIQKQFYDIEERTVVRPVGSALLELDEPLSKTQKGPAIVSSVDERHQQHHAIAHEHHHEHHAVAVTPVSHHVHVTPQPIVAVTPVNHFVNQPHFIEQKPVHLHHEAQYISSTPAPVHFSSSEAVLVSSTPIPHLESDDSIIVDAAARNVAAAEHAVYEAKLAHREAVARAHHNAQGYSGVEAYSNGEIYQPQQVLVHHAEEEVRHLRKLSHEEAHDNQKKLLTLLTARGGVAEVGFGRSGHSEHVGDAGISRARVLSATPSPHHEPVEEKVNTRRIVVSRPVQTLQEIDVIEPATKIHTVAVNEPTVIKTAKLGYERVRTSVPVYGKALAPAIAHAQVPVGYYQHHH